MGLFNNLFGSMDAAAKAVREKAAANSAPDTPMPFGFKTSWLCIKADSPETVIKKLGLKDPMVSGWKFAFENCDHGMFVSPVLDGFVLVIGWGMDIITEDPKRLDEVGAMFPEVQYFASHRVVDYAAWVKYENGVKIRAYGYCGDRGVLVNEGDPTGEEIELGFVNFLPNNESDNEADWDKYDTPDEDTVVMIAAAWGIDTLKLDKYPASTGSYCKF